MLFFLLDSFPCLNNQTISPHNIYFTNLREFVSIKFPENVEFDLPEIDENFVFNFLSTLDISISTGLDGIGPRLLKLSSGVITKSLTFIVRKSIENGVFPLSWKQAKVTPLFKNGSRDEINNYRPISILPTLSKLIEKFIQKIMYPFLMNLMLSIDHKVVLGRVILQKLRYY